MEKSLMESVSVENLRVIHESSLRVLSEFGLRIEHEAARKVLSNNGCPIGEGGVARFPAAVVEKAVSRAPRSYVMGARGKALEMSCDSTHFRCQSGCINVVDHRTGVFRPGTMSDAVELTRIMEEAEHLSVVSSLLFPWDAPLEDRDVATVEVMLEHSTKHIYVQPYTGPSAERIGRLAAEAGGKAGRPFVTFITAPTSPLLCASNELQIMEVACRYGIPVMVGSTPMCGATSPVTLAGQIVLAHAENLALFTLLQLMKPGLPVTYGIRPAVMDMRTGNSTWGDVEWGMATFVLAHLANHFGFITDVVGFPTDSKLSDFQAGAEKGFNAGLISLAPCNMVAGGGFIENILTASAAQVLLDNELAGIYKRVRQGIDWDEEHRAVDLIGRIGPGGNYLTDDHTLKFFRSEIYEPGIFDRNVRENWILKGSRDAAQSAAEQADLILKSKKEGD
ncbi:MAG TPA: trimethylamine methyltransferase family protein [Spirochaetia bacterium]|nr:trimethylamine methyltransferase family protein [Spirochaetia bacterium]